MENNEEIIKKITTQVMDLWHLGFCTSKYYSKLKKNAQKNTKDVIQDLLSVMYHDFELKPDDWSAEAMKEYCTNTIFQEFYSERDEKYFKSIADVLLAFFIFLEDRKLHKNASDIIDVIKQHGSSIFKTYEEMSKNKDKYSKEKEEEIRLEVKNLIVEFLETKFFTDLDDKYKDYYCEEIILNFSEFMYHHNLQEPKNWNVSGMVQVCIDVIPRKIMADALYFESIHPSLRAFLSFMDSKNINSRSKIIIKTIDEIKEDIIESSKESSDWGIGKQILNQAISNDIDISDENKLKSFLNSMMGKPLNRPDNYEEEEDDDDNIIPFVRKDIKIGRNDPCPCGSGKKYKKCCG
jgi:hypothetical protein